MPWVKIDEQFATHPKVLDAGPLGMALQIAALCYCNQHLTNGHLSRAAAATLLSFEGLGMRMWTNELIGGGEDASWDLVVEDLVTAGLWHELGHDCPDCPEVRPGGFYLHDYLNYQPSKAEVEAEREAKRRAGSAGGKASAQARAAARAQAGATAKGQAESKPDPVPDPVPQSSSSARASKRDRSITEEEETECNQDRAFADACWLLAERAYNAQPPGAVKVKTPWMVSTRKERMERHADAARAIFAIAPDTPADELADILEPDPSKPRPVLRRVYRCATCSDSGQVRNDDDLDLPNLLPCPDCSVVEGVSA